MYTNHAHSESLALYIMFLVRMLTCSRISLRLELCPKATVTCTRQG